MDCGYIYVLWCWVATVQRKQTCVLMLTCARTCILR